MNLLKSEPAVSAGLVAAVVSLAAAFGLHWSAPVVGAILAVLSLALSVIVRSRVTPVATPPAARPAPAPEPVSPSA
jgi:hypothetical protein